MPRSSEAKTVIRDLGDGLALRRATPEDTEALVAFSGRTFGRPGSRDSFVMNWTRDLMTGRNPTCGPRDFTIVEDRGTGEIVSSLCLLNQRWSYAGVEFPIGRPELVVTDPKYRRRGLVRAQFEVIHEWSAQRKHVLQAITGIPNFYRQFDYEMALELDAGQHRRGHKSEVPELKKGATEPYLVRPAVEADLPFMARTYAHARRRSLVSHVLPSRMWRYCAFGRTETDPFCVVTTPKGERVGLLVHTSVLPWAPTVSVRLYELKPGANWLDVTPPVLRYLVTKGSEFAARDKRPFEWLSFQVGTQHPAYDAMPDFLRSAGDPYAYYVRVPDLPGFLRLIAPVLEERLAHSIAPGWTGELKLSFFRDGLRLTFAKGKLTASEPWSPAHNGESACFRGGTFLHLLFGMHSMEELRHLNPDCSASSREAKALLPILFPKQHSSVWAVA
jgi:hypothetical protein